MISSMARSEKKPESEKKGARSGASLGVTYVDEEIRAALDAYMASHNATAEHPATLRSSVEAALKVYLSPKGFWPWPPPNKPPDKPE
jgi:hypothetical protein